MVRGSTAMTSSRSSAWTVATRGSAATTTVRSAGATWVGGAAPRNVDEPDTTGVVDDRLVVEVIVVLDPTTAATVDVMVSLASSPVDVVDVAAVLDSTGRRAVTPVAAVPDVAVVVDASW